MARNELVDGLVAAADREVDFHPKQLNGKTVITAWKRRQDTLIRHADAIEALEKRTAELDARLKQVESSPF
jgi:hypothetical protein